MIEGQEGVTWEHWCALADACEQHGVETLYRSDHYISQSAEATNVAHDAWATLAGLGVRTRTFLLVRLGVSWSMPQHSLAVTDWLVHRQTTLQIYTYRTRSGPQ